MQLFVNPPLHIEEHTIYIIPTISALNTGYFFTPILNSGKIKYNNIIAPKNHSPKI